MGKARFIQGRAQPSSGTSFEDETEKWMMDSDIYAFVKTDTRGQIEVHSSDSENERRQLEQEEDSDAAGEAERMVRQGWRSSIGLGAMHAQNIAGR
jgi:hypothetical protein